MSCPLDAMLGVVLPQEMKRAAREGGMVESITGKNSRPTSKFDDMQKRQILRKTPENHHQNKDDLEKEAFGRSSGRKAGHPHQGSLQSWEKENIRRRERKNEEYDWTEPTRRYRERLNSNPPGGQKPPGQKQKRKKQKTPILLTVRYQQSGHRLPKAALTTGKREHGGRHQRK